MGVSVYLSNGYMQIAVGTATKKQVKIQQLYHLKLKEGCLLNGVIIAENDLIDEIKRIWETYQLPAKDVRLIVDSTQLFTKLITIPTLNEKKSQELLKKEFSEVEDQDNYIFDYRELNAHGAPKGMSPVIAIAANRTFVLGYKKLFQEAGVELTSIDVSLNGESKALEIISEIGDDTFIIANLDDNNLVCTLVVKGMIKYFNRARIFSEKGTKDFAKEVTQRINGILQFASADYKEAEISDVLLGSVEDKDYANLAEAIDALGVNAVLPPGVNACTVPSPEEIHEECIFVEGSHPLANYTYTIGNLLQTKKDINLIRDISKKEKRESGGLDLGEFKIFILPAIALGVCMIASVGLLVWNGVSENRISEIETYVSSENVQAKYEEALQLDDENMSQTQITGEADRLTQILKSYPQANSKVEDAIRACAGDRVAITVDAYGASSGMYEFTAMAEDVTYIYDFINQLQETNLFGDLEYSGYNYTDETAKYDIHVNGYLSEDAGK